MCNACVYMCVLYIFGRFDLRKGPHTRGVLKCVFECDIVGSD